MSYVPWYIGTLIGGVSLAAMNAMKKSMDLSVSNFIILIPLLIVVQLGFWYGFRNCPNFIVSWYTGSAMSAASAILISLLFFNEPLSPRVLCGAGCVVLGQIILMWR